MYVKVTMCESMELIAALGAELPRKCGVDVFYMVVVVVVVVSHIQRIGCQPEKEYMVANPARGLLNRKKRTKENVWQHTPPPPPPHTARSEKNK